MSHLFQENNDAPMIKKASVIVVRMISSRLTSINPAVRYSNAFNGVTFKRFSAPFLR